ncbi:hypothetical protein P154DRAFT_274935 [Amniculicola lignicola CBS 123094]|uniref:Uncharacterized protein n=1 Tax=Amniculicola lignicola CBS 123094 TaxID=1392246 RepID=A0A6A5W6N5_9PLEO|nr:hypothetical protein P154DRAFT_274935 [Amniculicola lignicola CBS 123094]
MGIDGLAVGCMAGGWLAMPGEQSHGPRCEDDDDDDVHMQSGKRCKRNGRSSGTGLLACLPACLPACLLACLLACLPACLLPCRPTVLARLPCCTREGSARRPRRSLPFPDRGLAWPLLYDSPRLRRGRKRLEAHRRHSDSGEERPLS